jgi:hypothetical protein
VEDENGQTGIKQDSLVTKVLNSDKNIARQKKTCFKVFGVVWMRYKFWDVMFCHWVSGSFIDPTKCLFKSQRGQDS